jgi:hypothetical protein
MMNKIGLDRADALHSNAKLLTPQTVRQFRGREGAVEQADERTALELIATHDALLPDPTPEWMYK